MAQALLEEVACGGCVDTQHQHVVIMLMALGPKDVSKVRFGKLSPFAIQLLRDIHQFLHLTFRVEADPSSNSTMYAILMVPTLFVKATTHLV